MSLQAANAKPSKAEVRSVFPALGLAGLIPMLQAGFASPDGTLWKSVPFIAVCLVLAAIGSYGLLQFAKHWGGRAVAPAFVAVIYGLVTFGSPPIAVLIALVITFMLVCYVAAPDRIDAAVHATEETLRAEAQQREATRQATRHSKEEGLRAEIRQRDEALKAKEEALQAAIGERDELRSQARSDSVQLVSRNDMEQAKHEATIAGIEFRAGEREKELLAEIERLKAVNEQLNDRFPKFIANVFEIQPSEPEGGPNLRIALGVNIGNSGAKSSVINYAVQARTVHGVSVTVQIAPLPEFPVLVVGSRVIRYLPEHYIMTRTRNTPVERGAPVDGIIPCMFVGISNLREIDLLSLRVTFADGTGDVDGKARWWSTEELTSLAEVDMNPQRVRIGLPSAEPR